MPRVIRILSLVVLAAGVSMPARGQDVPSSFATLQSVVKPGDRVLVIDASGLETSGRLFSLNPATLTVTSAAGTRRFNPDEVVVVRQPRADSLLNGIAIGAAIGGGLGLAELSCGPYCGSSGAATASGLLWGVGIGALVDGLEKTPRDVFRRGAGTSASVALSPVVARHATGGSVVVRW